MRAASQDIATAALLLFRHAAPGLSAACATFQDGPRMTTPPRCITLAPADAVASLAARMAEAHPRACIASPAATFSGSAPVQAMGIVMDLDLHPDESLARLREMLGPPTLVVASGGTSKCPHTGATADNLLAHWRLAEPVPPAGHVALEEASMLAAAAVGFGLGCTAPVGSYARWPGTLNHRPCFGVGTAAGPRVATIREANPDAELDLARLIAANRGPLPMPGGQYAASIRWQAKNLAANDWHRLPWMRGRPHLQALFRRMWGL